MVIVKLQGGLGNQMFQYAAAKSLATHLGTDFKLDLEFLLDRTPRENFVYRNYDLDIFAMSPDFASAKETEKYSQKAVSKAGVWFNAFKKMLKPSKYYYEPHFHFSPEFFELPAECYLEGYWQSPKYFNAIEKEIRSDFSFKDRILKTSDEIAESIKSTNSVCINVRRGDFLTNNFHGVCDMKYFEPAIEVMNSKVKDAHFFIFSDDPQWCIDNFKLEYPVTFVGHEHAGHKFSNYLQLMALCKHFIIPNSSFAWWAIWLGNKNGVVIAPKIWFTDEKWDSKDLISENWLRIQN